MPKATSWSCRLQLERAGDFSQTAGLSRLLDPNTSAVPGERTEFANKTIPANFAMRDPVGSALVELYPDPEPFGPGHAQ